MSAGPILCGACGEDVGSPGWTLHDSYHGIKGEFDVRKCTTCGSTSVNGIPSDLADYYPGDYYSFSETSKNGPSYVLLAVQARLLRASLLGPLLVGGLPRKVNIDAAIADAGRDQRLRVLDVGCGAGAALDLYRRLGWETVGIEPGAGASIAARCHQVHQVTLADAPRLPACDLIRLRHIIEHVEDPKSALRQAVSPGRRSGHAVYLEWPNLRGKLAAVFGPSYWQLDPPRHLTIPTLDLMWDWLSELGYSVRLALTSTYGEGIAWSIYHRRARRAGRQYVHTRDKAASKVRITRALAGVLAPALDWRGVGDSIRLIATVGSVDWFEALPPPLRDTETALRAARSLASR